MNTFVPLLAVLSAVLLSSCGEAADAAKPLPPADARAVAALDATARALYGQLAATPGNLLFSPASVVTALGLTTSGARGATADELAMVLHQPVPDHPAIAALLGRHRGATDYDLTSANGLWPDRRVQLVPAFASLAAGTYGATAEPLDFTATVATADTINRWVAAKTAGRISKALDPSDVPDPGSLLLANAVYFHGQWETPFRPGLTVAETFRSPGGPRQVRMMHRHGELAAGRTATTLLVELPYRGGLHLLLLVPTADDGLPALERDLAVQGLAALATGLTPQPVELALPRLHLAWRGDLTAAVQGLGARRAFDAEAADFTAMATGPRGLRLKTIIHLANMDLDEEGTEAAAVTIVGPVPAALPPPSPPPLVVTADHPFLFAIRDQAGAVLFLGRVVEP